MVMLRPSGKAHKIAMNVLKKKGVTVRPANANKEKKLSTPYLQH